MFTIKNGEKAHGLQPWDDITNEETLYIIEKHYSFQHSDEYKIILISKNKEYAEEKYKECLRMQDRINASEDYDYVVKYSLNAYPENYVDELNIFEPWGN